MKSEFEKLIHKDKYQVFLFCCPATIPFSFAIHPWFVINKKGNISRWEILYRKKQNDTSWDYLHKNYLEPFSGIPALPYSQLFPWDAKFLGFIEGDGNSAAFRMSEEIEHSPESYPYCLTYSLRGPNSNTYVEWILEKFQEFPTRLPLNAIGKNYKR